MRRLVYAPKVWIFIRSSNLGGKIFDVSSDVVRGSVTQNLGDLSKARFELRNRGWKWLRYRSDDPELDKKQIFLPMDLCTIWMQRIAGRPIQVFTGYLDSAPYYQAYPGVAVFEASCTLKKLAYNWFDPGLPVFHNWLRDNGWTFDAITGELLAGTPTPTEEAAILGVSGAKAGRTVSDVHLGELIGRFMVDIAGWDTQDVVIGNLPFGVAKAAAELRAQLEGEFQEARENSIQFFSSLLSLHGAEGFAVDPRQVSPSPLDRFSDSHSRGNPVKNLPMITKIVSVAGRANIPAWVPIFAALILSGMDPHRQVKRESQNPYWGYGLYSMRPTSELKLDNGKTIYYIDGQPISNVLDPGIATEIFVRRLNRYIGDQAAKRAIKNDTKAAIKWITKAIGYSPNTDNVNIDAVFQKANQLASVQQSKTPKSTPTQAVKPADTPPSSPIVQGKLSETERQVLKESYKNIAPEMGFVIMLIKNFNPSLTIEKPTQRLTPNQIFIKGSPTALERFFNALKGNQAFSKVEIFVGDKPMVLRDGVPNSSMPSSLKERGMILTGNIEYLRRLEIAIPKVEAPPAAEELGEEAGMTLQQLATFAANAAFAANFAFDTNVVAATTFIGEKALMNDISCLNAVKQLCQASLRTFRSLPDGRFLAFYPDYFGAHRQPYWIIRDIEIVDFGIQLNDQALATHVYVIGDSIMGSPAPSAELINSIASQGVATITQANMLDSFIARESDSDDGLTRLQESINFLEHYGARPHKETMPLIRNRDYEFLMAWQKFMWLWAQQFATTAQFTFQPEIMAGGLILFEDHHIQMFCESVTHNFDYESGFSTQAVLVAPSLDKSGNKSNMPGFALAGGVNTVGVGAG